MDADHLLQKDPGAPARTKPSRCMRGLAKLKFTRRHLFTFLSAGCLLYIVQQMWSFDADRAAAVAVSYSELHDRHGDKPRDGLLVDTVGCRIPAMDPLSAEVRGMVDDFPTVVCADPPPLVRSNDTALELDRSLLAAYNAGDGVECCYTAMWRTAGPDWEANRATLMDGISHGNTIRFASACTPFETSTNVSVEFVRVTCKSKAGQQVYQDYHAFVPPKRPRGFQDSDPISPKELVSEDSLSVLVLGVDSVSRLNMMRKMPLTRAFLDKLGAVDMLGYNKVEDNTFPNLVPMLSGLSVPELRKECWSQDYTHFDACPWVWKRFNQEGYVNMFAEDTAWMGLFHYLKRGFVHQPTDYDPRPLLYLGEKELGRGGGLNAKYCIGQRHQLEVLFDYGVKFLRGMEAQRRKFFSLVWGTSLSHDWLNQPDEADALFESTLRRVVDSGVLNRTALIFMSDHGLRFGEILSTFQGQLENLLPLMYVVMPDWVRRRYPDAMRNLAINRRRLVTVYDLHVTLESLMDLRSLEGGRLAKEGADLAKAFADPRRTPPRGVNLFTAIPKERTCEDAGVPENYCSCQHLSAAKPQDPDVRRAAEFVVQQVNEMLAGSVGCSVLSLDAVVDARRGEPLPSRTYWLQRQQQQQQADESEFQVQLRTAPGGALFSATVRDRGPKHGGMMLGGTVSRLNEYGSTSWCVSKTALRPLCYCTAPAPATTTSTAAPNNPV